MSNQPPITPKTTMMTPLEQLAAAAETHSNSNPISNATTTRSSTINTAPRNYTAEELEAAATLLTVVKPVEHPKEDEDAAYILLAMKESHVSLESDDERTITDSERTVTDSERTVTAVLTPVLTPNRRATPPSPSPAPNRPQEAGSVLLDAAAVSASPPPAKTESPQENTAMKKARKDRGPQNDV